MEPQKKIMIYSKEVTKSHQLAGKYKQAITPLNELLIKEGLKRTPFTLEEVLDIDKIEIMYKTGCGSRQETMDFCMGLCCNQMLLVEAKFRVSQPRNIKKNDIENKIRYSITLLGQDTPVAKEKVFLFSPDTVDLARRYLARLFNNNPRLKVYTVNEFKDSYF
jgi:hypothetical protein